MTRRSRNDVVAAAGRLFAQRGYHNTSMRELGRELGLEGSSLYSHVDGKQQLLVEVVGRGADFFQDAAQAAVATDGSAAQRLEALIRAHISVVLDYRDEVRTFLNEAYALDEQHRALVIESRDRYEAAFRSVLKEGAADGSFRADLDPVTDSIFVLSILNAIERWYRAEGTVDREQLASRVYQFSLEGIS